MGLLNIHGLKSLESRKFERKGVLQSGKLKKFNEPGSWRQSI